MSADFCDAQVRKTIVRRLGTVQTKIWRADELGSAELLRGSFANYSYDVHTHDKACFALITKGAVRIKMRGAEFVVRAGDLYAIDAEEPNAGWPVDDHGWSLRTLYVEMSQLQAILGDGDEGVGRTPALAGPIIRDPGLNPLFRGVHRCSESAGPRLKREEAYCKFVSRLFERHMRAKTTIPESGREQRAIRLARDFLDHHLDEHVHLADIGHAAGLPPFRLFRAFQQATGMTPHGYQRQARVRFAAGMIRLGHSLSDAAAASGFADQAHLTRSFRQTMGITPGAYRSAYLPVLAS